MDVSLSELWELVLDREAWRAVIHGVGHDWATDLIWWSSNPISGRITRESHNPQRYMHPNIHSSTVYNSQDMEAI